MGSLYRSKHELVLVFQNGAGRFQNNVSLGATGRYRTNVWDYPGINTLRNGRMDELAMHPTVKPLALVADATPTKPHTLHQLRSIFPRVAHLGADLPRFDRASTDGKKVDSAPSLEASRTPGGDRDPAKHGSLVMAKSKTGGARLVPLPFTTFGEIIALDLVAHVYCPSCYDHRSIDPSAEHLRARCFATARFRCTKVRHIGEVCGSLGSVAIQPAILLPVGGPDPLAFLSCKRCLPPWEINHVPIDQPPWSLVNREAGDCFRCPGCRRPVSWHIHGPAWRPSYAYAQADTVMSGRAIRLGVK